MKRIAILILLSFYCLNGSAQPFSISGYTLTDGLSQSVVNCIFQDSRGYIWLGTQNGLNRFDGFTFEVHLYRPDDTTSISNNWIYCITEDISGDLWIGTKGGLNRYSAKKKGFERIRYTTPYPEEVTRYVYDVRCSRDGRILINTPPVLTLCDPRDMSFVHHTASLPYDGSVKDYRIPLLETSDGNIWTGSTRGLACFTPSTGRFRILDIPGQALNENSNYNITALYEDTPGSLWIGTSRGLFLLNGNDTIHIKPEQVLPETHFPVNLPIRAILEDLSGRIWMATEGSGLARITRHNGHFSWETFTAENNGLFHNILLSLAVDRSENLWIGTLSGINKTDLKKQKFRLYRKTGSPSSVDLTGNVIASLFKDSVGTIWAGTWGQGLNLIDRGSGKVEHYASNLGGRNYIPNDYVHTIFEDPSHRVWIGTRDGLLGYVESDRRFVRPQKLENNPGLPDLTGLRIFRMIKGRNGDYWIATQNGLFRKKAGGPHLERFSAEAPSDHRIGSNQVYTVLEDCDGTIWIGTSEGLDAFNPETLKITRFRKAAGKSNTLSDDFVTTLCEDHNGDIWIGTSSYVNRFSKKDSVFTYFSKEDGLPGNLIYSILEDKNQGIWFASGNGLCRYDPSTNTFQPFTEEEGLQSPEFNLNASFLAEDGELFFGGMNGFNAFYPDSIYTNPHIPPMTFSGIWKMARGNRQSLQPDEDNRIVLKHNDYDFTVEFAALEFTNPRENRYKYLLEGSGSEWVDIGNRNFVAFSSLSPGEYTLRVKGSNNDGVWNEEGASLRILVRPPWWASRLAWSSYIAVILMGVWSLFRIREKQHIRDRMLLEEKVRERTLLIEKQKSEILRKNDELYALNTSKDKFFSIIGHDLRNPFNAIIGLTDLLLMDLPGTPPGKLQNSLENIRGSSLQAHQLLENLLLWARSHTGMLTFTPEQVDLVELAADGIALVKAQAIGKNITLHTGFPAKAVLAADVNMIRTILRNLLTNAVKFTRQNGDVWISISPGEQTCQLSVRDNGIGIPPESKATLFDIGTSHKSRGTGQEPGTGLGLILCREFAEKHGGWIEVESEPGTGSEFRVILPVK